MNVLNKRNVSDRIINNILDILREKSATKIKNEKDRANARMETLIVRAYVHEPQMMYAGCRKIIQPVVPEKRLSDADIRNRAESLRLTERTVREEMVAWTYTMVARIYEGMAGNEAAIQGAVEAIQKHTARGSKTADARSRMVLIALFELVPELAATEEKGLIEDLGRNYCHMCLQAILRSIVYDVTRCAGDPKIDAMTSVDALRREVYLARNELREYRELVEAADAEFDNKLEELKQQEIAAFFSALNNEKYGFLIDSLYLHRKACAEARREGEKIPYAMEGVPTFLDRFLRFLCDAGISPASKFAPHSYHRLTLSQMDGCRFDPSPERTTPIKDGQTVLVKVLSSGWKLGDTIISYPFLQEDIEN